MTIATDERFACIRYGLTSDGTMSTHVSNCPDYGSSDCPISMGYESGKACERCRSEEQYERLTEILRRRG